MQEEEPLNQEAGAPVEDEPAVEAAEPTAEPAATEAVPAAAESTRKWFIIHT